VRIFGTEDRPTKRPIPVRDEMFDYIVFKASDIQDMVVVEQAKHSELFMDPAIVSCSGFTTADRSELPPMMHACKLTQGEGLMCSANCLAPETLSNKLRDLMLQGRSAPENVGRGESIINAGIFSL